MAKRKKPGKQLSPVSRGRGKLTAPDQLLNEVRDLIRQTREGVARAVDSALVLLYWQVGQRIRVEILKHRRATYGAEIISTLSNKLTAEFGNGYSQPNLSRMSRFAEVFPNPQIVSASATWNASSWSWAAASPSSPGRNVWSSIRRTTTSTCYSTTAACAGWWPSS